MAILEAPQNMTWEEIVSELNQMKADPQIYDRERESVLVTERIKQFCARCDLPTPDQAMKLHEKEQELNDRACMSLTDPNHPSNLRYTGNHIEHWLGDDANQIADDISKLSPDKLHTVHVVSKTGMNKKFNIERNENKFTFYMLTNMFGADTQTSLSGGYERMLSEVTRVLAR